MAIALDQENGGVNSLFDDEFIQQFPSAMGTAATGSVELAYDVAKATAAELKAVGVNWIMGPCLDVLTNIKNQPLGVRSVGDDPVEVSQFGVAFMNGYKDAGLVTCGKHFPSYGNLEFLGSSLDVPMITDSLEQLSLKALVPFREAIDHGIDAMMVGGCAMSSAGVEAMHACLSDQVVQALLREEMGFDGVVVSECLEMEALSYNIGVGGGTVMALNAGCDIMLVCRSYTGQQEAIEGLKVGLENGVVTKKRIQQSLSRVLQMKAKHMTWEKALAPGGISLLSSLQTSHSDLSREAYNSSIAIVRDRDRLLPLSNLLDADDEILLLTPLVRPLPASAAALQASHDSPGSTAWLANSPSLNGESVFQGFGRCLARQRGGRVLHTSYTANGVRPVHENLINRASAVIVITADANRNLYQQGFTKHVAMICQLSQVGEKREKPLVIVSVSSPYDFAMDPSLGTYVCTFDFTETALQALVDVFSGDVSPTGALPGSLRQNQKVHQAKQHWLAESFNEDRDRKGLDFLVTSVLQECPVNQRSALIGCSSGTFLLEEEEVVVESHFVVRNSSTQAVYGFCATYYFESTGVGIIGPILVDPQRRNLSIGHSLHNRAVKSLLRNDNIKRLQLGCKLPSVYLGIPSSNNLERKRLRHWFANLGWRNWMARPVCSMLLTSLNEWSLPEQILQSLKHADVDFDLVQGLEHQDEILDLVRTSSRTGNTEIYSLALRDDTGCAILLARRQTDATLLGTVVLFTQKATWAHAVPALKDSEETAGGISSPVISPSAGDYSTLLQGLVVLAIRQHQRQGSTAVLLDCVGDLLCKLNNISLTRCRWTTMAI